MLQQLGKYKKSSFNILNIIIMGTVHQLTLNQIRKNKKLNYVETYLSNDRTNTYNLLKESGGVKGVPGRKERRFVKHVTNDRADLPSIDELKSKLLD